VGTRPDDPRQLSFPESGDLSALPEAPLIRASNFPVNAIWEKCRSLLQSHAPAGAWVAYISSLRPGTIEGTSLVLFAPSAFVKDRLEQRHLDLLTDALRSCDARLDSVTIRIDPLPYDTDGALSSSSPANSGDSSRFSDNNAILAAPLKTAPDLPVNGPSSDQRTDRIRTTLNPLYTFEAFVTGPSNRFAHAACLAVAESPGSAYNPLFIHGGVGLGKTHLLHAIGNSVTENASRIDVRYVSTESLMNEFIDAIRTKEMTDFKKRYRECGVLLIDDIQFMEGRTGSFHEEFFYTFNALYGSARQIVLTSDRPPKSFHTIEDRLKSRFLSGLLVDVQPPELETRLAILQRRALRERLPVPESVCQFIAEHVPDNIREMEGALLRVVAYATLNGHPLTLALATQVLSDLSTPTHPHLTPDVILQATSEQFGFTEDELRGPSRRRPLVTARQIGMYVCRELTSYSYPAIAREFGGRDHTTVIHAVDKIGSLMKQRQSVYEQVTRLIQYLKATTSS